MGGVPGGDETSGGEEVAGFVQVHGVPGGTGGCGISRP